MAVVWLGLAGCAALEKGAGQRSECSRVAALSRAGEHKPAVDAARDLTKAGRSCPPDIQELLKESRSRIDEADLHVRKALGSRKGGDLLSARAELDRALEIYQKYYWVQTLKKNVERSIQAELDSLRNEASYLESRGDARAALSRIRSAITLSPGDGGLVSEAARLEDLIDREQSEKSVQNLLDQARAHLEEGRFNEAQRVLTKGDSLVLLGTRGEDLLVEVLEQRREHIRQRYDDATEMEKRGEMDAAANQILYVLDLTVPGEALSIQVVRFARLLGMKFYSAGELSRARELWAKALTLEPDNAKLLSYVKEVDTRLEDLDRIKKGGKEAGGE